MNSRIPVVVLYGDGVFRGCTYYVYFDDMRAITDLYAMQNRDEDDMDDNW